MLGDLVEEGLYDRLVAYGAGPAGHRIPSIASPASRPSPKPCGACVGVARRATDVRLDYERCLRGQGRDVHRHRRGAGSRAARAPNAEGVRLEIEPPRSSNDAEVGAPIAVNGCCLTVVEHGDAAGPPTR